MRPALRTAILALAAAAVCAAERGGVIGTYDIAYTDGKHHQRMVLVFTADRLAMLSPTSSETIIDAGPQPDAEDDLAGAAAWMPYAPRSDSGKSGFRTTDSGYAISGTIAANAGHAGVSSSSRSSTSSIGGGGGMESPIWLSSAMKARILPNSISSSNVNGQQSTTMRFAADAPTALVARVVTKTSTRELPIDLHDVELP